MPERVHERAYNSTGAYRGSAKSRHQEDNLARRRFQQGSLQNHNGFWRYRYRENRIDPTTGAIKRMHAPAVTIGPAPGNAFGLKAMTEKEAWREVQRKFISVINAEATTPLCGMTLEDFVEHKFRPEHLELRLRRSTRKFNESILANHILPKLGKMPLREIRRDHVQQAVSAALADGRSVQTARHIKNICSSIFRHAIECDYVATGNPAAKVRLPELRRRIPAALSFQDVSNLLAMLESPARELCMFAVLTGLNIAEVLGVRWHRINLTDQPRFQAGETLPAWTIAIREQWYRGAWTPTKASTRVRNVPVPEALRPVLAEMARREKFTGPTDPVFAARTGKPADEHNIMRRHIKPAARSLGLVVSWHVFRRTFATLADQAEMTAGQRQALLGHASATMTARYTQTGTNEVRTAIDRLGAMLQGTAPDAHAIERAAAALLAMPAQGAIS